MTQQTTDTITTEQVAEAVRRGREDSGQSWKISAIRHLRVATGAGLNEAKTLIERYEATGDCRTEDEITRDRLAEAEATIERLTGPEARERLARHLYTRAVKAAAMTPAWNRQDEEVKERWRVEADELVAVIAGKEG